MKIEKIKLPKEGNICLPCAIVLYFLTQQVFLHATHVSQVFIIYYRIAVTHVILKDAF